MLHIAAKKGFINIVEHILQYNDDFKIPIDCKKNNGMTPAMCATKNGHLYVLKCLKNGGADLKLPLDKTGQGSINILYLAA